jgi:hypothetical protein
MVICKEGRGTRKRGALEDENTRKEEEGKEGSRPRRRLSFHLDPIRSEQ